MSTAGGSIYTSTDSGLTWTEQTTAGSRDWIAITSSADGYKFAAAALAGSIYTYDGTPLTAPGNASTPTLPNTGIAPPLTANTLPFAAPALVIGSIFLLLAVIVAITFKRT